MGAIIATSAMALGIWRLAQSGVSDAPADALAAASRRAGDVHGRRERARQLARSPQPSDYAELLHELEDPDPWVRMWGVSGLRRLRNPESIPLIRSLLRDSDINVRYNSMETLLGMGDYGVLAILAAADDIAVLVPAIEYAGRLGNPHSIPYLVRLVGSSTDAVREAALRAVAQVDGLIGLEDAGAQDSERVRQWWKDVGRFKYGGSYAAPTSQPGA